MMYASTILYFLLTFYEQFAKAVTGRIPLFWYSIIPEMFIKFNKEDSSRGLYLYIKSLKTAR